VRQPREDGGETVLGPLNLALLSAPRVTALDAGRAVPGGELAILGQAFPTRPESLRLTLVDTGEGEHPLAVGSTAPDRIIAPLPSDLPPGAYRLRLQAADGQGEWVDAIFASPQAAQVNVSSGNVAFRLCDAGQVKDDTLAFYLDGVYQGRFQGSDGGRVFRVAERPTDNVLADPPCAP